MITFNNTGISNIITKSGRALVYTDILSAITYTGLTEDKTYTGVVSGDTCQITVLDITYTGTTQNDISTVIISDTTYTGLTYTGYTFPFDILTKFDITITGGTFYTGTTNLIYKWAMYIPTLTNTTLGEYLTQHADEYEQDILRKEAIWSISPHTREVEDMFGTGTTIVDIPKSEVVRPTIPDFEEVAAEIGLTNSKMLMSLWNEDEYLTKRLSYYETRDIFTNENVTTLEAAKTKKLTQITKVANDLLWTYISKNMKDVTLSSTEVMTLRDTYREQLNEQIVIMTEEVNDLTTIEETLLYKVGFNMSKILYNTELQRFYGEARAIYHLGTPQSLVLPANVIELELTEDPQPSYSAQTQKLTSQRVVDVENKKWNLEWTIVNKTDYEIGLEDWDDTHFSLRIVAPLQLIMDDIGIKMYGWFQINKLTIVRKLPNVRLYCNSILPEHQAVVDNLQGLIVVQSRPVPITVTPSSISTGLTNQTYQLSVDDHYGIDILSACTFSATTSKVSISNEGLITIGSETGTTSVKVIYSGTTVTLPITIYFYGDVTTTAGSGLDGAYTGYTGETFQAYANINENNVTSVCSWISNDVNVATVGLHTGLITFVGVGSTSIKATYPSGSFMSRNCIVD